MILQDCLQTISRWCKTPHASAVLGSEGWAKEHGSSFSFHSNELLKKVVEHPCFKKEAATDVVKRISAVAHDKFKARVDKQVQEMLDVFGLRRKALTSALEVLRKGEGKHTPPELDEESAKRDSDKYMEVESCFTRDLPLLSAGGRHISQKVDGIMRFLRFERVASSGSTSWIATDITDLKLPLRDRAKNLLEASAMLRTCATGVNLAEVSGADAIMQAVPFSEAIADADAFTDDMVRWGRLTWDRHLNEAFNLLEAAVPEKAVMMNPMLLTNAALQDVVLKNPHRKNIPCRMIALQDVKSFAASLAQVDKRLIGMEKFEKMDKLVTLARLAVGCSYTLDRVKDLQNQDAQQKAGQKDSRSDRQKHAQETMNKLTTKGVPVPKFISELLNRVKDGGEIGAEFAPAAAPSGEASAAPAAPAAAPSAASAAPAAPASSDEASAAGEASAAPAAPEAAPSAAPAAPASAPSPMPSVLPLPPRKKLPAAEPSEAVITDSGRKEVLKADREPFEGERWAVITDPSQTVDDDERVFADRDGYFWLCKDAVSSS